MRQVLDTKSQVLWRILIKASKTKRWKSTSLSWSSVSARLWVRLSIPQGGSQQFLFWPWSVSFEIKISHRRQTSISLIPHHLFNIWTTVLQIFLYIAYKLCWLSSSSSSSCIIRCLTRFRDSRHYLKWGLNITVAMVTAVARKPKKNKLWPYFEKMV